METERLSVVDEIVLGLYACTNKVLILACVFSLLGVVFGQEPTGTKLAQAIVSGVLGGIGASIGSLVTIVYLFWISTSKSWERYNEDFTGELTAQEKRFLTLGLALVGLVVIAVSAVGLVFWNLMGVWAAVALLAAQIAGGAFYIWEVFKVTPEM